MKYVYLVNAQKLSFSVPIVLCSLLT